MPRLLAVLALVSLWALPALAAGEQPWVDAERFQAQQPAPPPAAAPAPAAPAAPQAPAAPPAPPAQAAPPAAKPAAQPDYADQPEIQRRRKARLAYTQALDEFNAGHYRQAARLFQQHLAVFPENGQARKYLAMSRKLQKAQTHGTLKVLSRPKAQVQLDGHLRGETPLTLDELPVGSHFLQVQAGGVRQGRPVEIKPMTTTTVEFDLTPVEIQSTAQPRAPAGSRAFAAARASLVPPQGWKPTEDAAKRQVSLWTPDKEAMIQVNLATAAPGMSLESFVAEFEKGAVGRPGGALQHKANGKKGSVAGRPAYQALYQGKDGQATVVFLSVGERVYILSLICPPARQAELEPAFRAVLQSFAPLP
ncbi:MAG: PEGA domain-containing protein [Desulfarculaceae bacterium]|nr:PEGA domain-containing protein [Desulfarculaceae bacterium]